MRPRNILVLSIETYLLLLLEATLPQEKGNPGKCCWHKQTLWGFSIQTSQFTWQRCFHLLICAFMCQKPPFVANEIIFFPQFWRSCHSFSNATLQNVLQNREMESPPLSWQEIKCYLLGFDNKITQETYSKGVTINPISGTL